MADYKYCIYRLGAIQTKLAGAEGRQAAQLHQERRDLERELKLTTDQLKTINAIIADVDQENKLRILTTESIFAIKAQMIDRIRRVIPEFSQDHDFDLVVEGNDLRVTLVEKKLTKI